MEKTIIDSLDEYIADIHKDDEDRAKHLHVTDLSQCPAKVWLQKTGKWQPEPSVAKIRRFEVGHQIEEFITVGLLGKDYEELPENKQQMEWKKLNLVGTPDILAKRKSDGVPVLIEVKSSHPFKFDKMGNGADKHHEEQIMIYANKLLKDYPNLELYIVYFSLDGRMLQHKIKYNPNVVTDAFLRAMSLNEHIKNDTMPKPADNVMFEDGKWVPNWRARYNVLDGVYHIIHGGEQLTESQWRYRAKKRCDELNGK